MNRMRASIGAMRGRRREYLKYREAARALVHARIAHFNQAGEYQVRRIAIRNSKTRWGSCSKQGNLNFHYKLALLPERVRDYVIVHELCHLKEFNHSKALWAHVAAVLPDYRELLVQLRMQQRVLR